MSATTRWTQYDILAAGSAGVGGTNGLGTRGYSVATGVSGKDVFNIGAGNNRLRLKIDDGVERFVTLVSGTELDPRFLARDITEKLHKLDIGTDGYDYAQFVWENGQFILYSGSLGTGSYATIMSGTSTAHLELGWGSQTPGGAAPPAHSNWGLTVSGTYNGFFDETYKIVANKENPISTVTKGNSNHYTGEITAGGAYNYTSSDVTYTLNIDTSDGFNMGGGTGNVPKLSWTVSAGSDSGGPVELLYPDYWYNVGTMGLMVKFTEGVFSSCPPGTPAWTILCNQASEVVSGNNDAGIDTAMYFYGSTRGDDTVTPIVCRDSYTTQLGSRGLSMKFTGTGNFYAGDEFYVICKPPQPSSLDTGITNVNYGNVTVSTESAVKCVMFEIMSGAIEISTIKFGLQSHGTFEHHKESNSDTYFRFGTVGPGDPAGLSTTDGLEWRENVTPADLSDPDDVPPPYLSAINHSLAVVSDADDSEEVGSSCYMGMTSDPIFMNIRLGASEVGANSTINSRCFFDYS